MRKYQKPPSALQRAVFFVGLQFVGTRETPSIALLQLIAPLLVAEMWYSGRKAWKSNPDRVVENQPTTVCHGRMS